MEKNGFVRTRAAFVLERDENRDEECVRVHETPIKNLSNDEGKEANFELEQLLSHFDNAYEDAFFEVGRHDFLSHLPFLYSLKKYSKF